jgi:hypothetical protein
VETTAAPVVKTITRGSLDLRDEKTDDRREHSRGPALPFGTAAYIIAARK